MSAVSLSWTDASDVSHTASYSSVGTHLIRTFDTTSLIVARDVVSAAFTRSGEAASAESELDTVQAAMDTAMAENALTLDNQEGRPEYADGRGDIH